jgi:hypothetical protein
MRSVFEVDQHGGTFRTRPLVFAGNSIATVNVPTDVQAAHTGGRNEKESANLKTCRSQETETFPKKIVG